MATKKITIKTPAIDASVIESETIETLAETQEELSSPTEGEPISDVSDESVEEITPEVANTDVPTNPNDLVWPTDVWGLTKDLRAAIVQAASRINGHEDKKALIDATLKIALAHLENKYTRDHADLLKLIADA